MAEIRVEKKKGGTPWWVYVLGLLVLLAILVFGVRSCATSDRARLDGADGAAKITTQGVGTATGERVTDVNVFGSAADKRSLVGRTVDLQNVAVARVLSDRVFTVTAGRGEMFVMLGDQLNTGPAEAATKIAPGQKLTLGGTFQAVPDQQTKDEQGRGLDQQEYRQMQGQEIYLRATAARNAG